MLNENSEIFRIRNLIVKIFLSIGLAQLKLIHILHFLSIPC